MHQPVATGAFGIPGSEPIKGLSNPVPAGGGDPNILELPAHTCGLGQPVATDGYGKPSKFEANV